MFYIQEHLLLNSRAYNQKEINRDLSFLFIFIDGIGIGKRDKSVNPFAAAKSKYFTSFLNKNDHHIPPYKDGIIIPTDACLGVKGLPQSATGQTSLFSGINAQKEIGRHLSGFPTPSLRAILKSTNILMDLSNNGKKVTFANAYHRKYFERLDKMISATTRILLSAEIKINYLEDLNAGKAVFHDLTNEYLIAEGYDVKKRTPFESGTVLANITKNHDLTLFEYVQTDTIGHKKDLVKAIDQVNKLDEYLDGILNTVDLDENTVMISSDHGNLEDVSVKTHTRNPVPTIVWGKEKKKFQERIRKITDITPLIIKLLGTAAV